MLRQTTIILALAALTAFGQTADADFKTVARAYEVKLNDFRAPVTTSGSLAMRECSECPMQSLRVTPDTRYRVNGNAVDLKEFRRLVLAVRDRNRPDLVVKHHLESDRVILVAMIDPGADRN